MSVAKLAHKFSLLTRKTAAAAGSWQMFVLAATIVITWILGGFYYGFASQLYQLIINSFTTVVTFLMVFLIQGATNRSEAAIQLKLDEIICALDKADSRLIDIENDTEQHFQEARERVNQAKG